MVIIGKLKAQSGAEAEMEKAFREMIAKVQDNEEGTLAYTLHRSQIDPTVFMFYERYRDKAAFDSHSSTPYIQELLATLGPLLDGFPTIEMYDELAELNR